MKTFEIYFHDLTLEAQANLLDKLSSVETEENWDLSPLAIINREDEEEPHALIKKEDEVDMPVKSNIDRVKDWKLFSDHMTSYIQNSTVDKYSIKDTGFDLITFTEPSFLIWNILKYCIRLINGHGKEHDIEKIVHYAEIWWIMKCKK